MKKKKVVMILLCIMLLVSMIPTGVGIASAAFSSGISGGGVVQVVYGGAGGGSVSTGSEGVNLNKNLKGFSPYDVVLVTGVTLNKTTDTIAAGNTDQLTATVQPSDATNQTLTWTTDTPSVATVDQTGLVTAVGPGNANITATTQDGSNLSATCAVTVQAASISVTGVTLDKATDSIATGGSDQLTAMITPDDAADQNVSWSSSDGSIATVNLDGMVTAVAPGSATITATTDDGSFTATCDVTVYTVSATGVSLSLTSDTITARSDTTLVAAVLIASMRPDNATDQNVTWSSDNQAVATVNQYGEVSAVEPGNANITATTDDGGFAATCAITVIPSLQVIPISTAQGLENVSNNLTGNYQQTSNINLTGYSWVPIGDIPYDDAQGNTEYQFESFSGNFDGGGKKITGSELFGEAFGTIENVNAGSLSSGNGFTGTNIGGLVGDVPSGTSLKISNCSFSGPFSGINSTLTEVGGLVGRSDGDISISNSSFSGPFSGINSTLTEVGGLVGMSDGGSTLTNDSFNGTLCGEESTLTDVGGLVGDEGGATAITNGYFNGTISGGYATLTEVGGLVGDASNTLAIIHSSSVGVINADGESTFCLVGGLVGDASDATITNCFFNGSIFSGEFNVLTGIGGLVGGSDGATITNCYSADAVSADGDGGLVGINGAGTVTSSYYDEDIAGPGNDAGTPEPTDLMMQQATFVNWDYSNIWAINEGVSYPYFGTSTAANVAVTGVTLNKYSDALQPGDSDQLVATVQPDDATDQNVSWSSDTPGVATVDQTGLVQAVASGTAKITVTTEDGGFTAVCQVIVSGSGSSGGGGGGPAVEISNSVSNSTPVVGQEIEYSVYLTNLGPDATTGVQVTDLLPSGLTCDSYTASQGTYDSTTGVWRVGTLPPAYSAELDIYAIPTNSVAGTTVTDTATLEYNPNGWGSSSVVIQVAALSTTQTYTVAYDGNGSTGGTVPVDGNSYDSGANVIVLDNTGGLSRTGYAFAGWNTAADESGTRYQQGDSFSMGSSDAILYAQWKQIVITISPDSLPGGTVGSSYSQSLTASGGTAPYTFTQTGNLPDGLTLGSDGTISGTPIQTGSYNFTVTGTDSGGSTGSQAYTLMVDPASTGGGGGPAVPQTYTVVYNANGATSGAAPADANSYQPGSQVTLLGNPGDLLKADYTFAGWNTVSDGSGTSYQQGDTFSISGNTTLFAQWTQNAPQVVITISPSTLPDGAVGTAYSQTLVASGGTAPYTFTETGNLPGGLTLGSDGALTGTPTTAVASSFTVTATDAESNTGSQAYTLTVDPVSTPPATAPTITGLTVTPSAMSLSVSQQGSAVATAVYSDNLIADVTVTAYATWFSSNNQVATVSAGRITAVAPGMSTITASYNGETGTVVVTVVTPPAPPAGGGGGTSPPAPQKPEQQTPPTSVLPVAPAPPTSVQPAQPVPPAPQQPTAPKRPLASQPVAQPSKPLVAQVVTPAPIVVAQATPAQPAPAAPTPTRRSLLPPVLPVIGGLALIAAIAAFIKKRSYVALLALLPNRAVSVAISLQPAGAAMASLAFDDTKRKPSKVTVDVVNGTGKAIAKGVVVARGQSTDIDLPILALGEKMRFTAKTRGYRNKSKERSVWSSPL